MLSSWPTDPVLSKSNVARNNFSHLPLLFILSHPSSPPAFLPPLFQTPITSPPINAAPFFLPSPLIVHFLLLGSGYSFNERDVYSPSPSLSSLSLNPTTTTLSTPNTHPTFSRLNPSPWPWRALVSRYSCFVLLFTSLFLSLSLCLSLSFFPVLHLFFSPEYFYLIF